MSVDLENLVADLHEEVRSRFFGKYRGVVLNVDDPEQMGRIQARVPEVLQEASSAWAVPCVPFAGAGHGLVLLPELGDGVWIEFEAGDIARPVWTGCWWGAGELPPPGGPQTRALVTTKGHKIVLDDLTDEVRVVHSGGAELKMTATELTITVGQSEIKLMKDGIYLVATKIDLNKGALVLGA